MGSGPKGADDLCFHTQEKFLLLRTYVPPFQGSIPASRVRQSAGAREQCSKAASSLVGSRGKKRGTNKERKKRRRKKRKKKGRIEGKKKNKEKEKEGKTRKTKRKGAAKKKKIDKKKKDHKIKDCIVGTPLLQNEEFMHYEI